MTRVFERAADPATPQMRALIVGAGAYPMAQAATIKAPNFNHLTSVGPSVLEFTRALIRDWDPKMAAPLVSVDLLLSDVAAPGGSQWQTLGVAGEVAQGTPIEPAAMAGLTAAVTAALAGAKSQDHFLFLCCGHGFWTQGGRYFVLSDFNTAAPNPWISVVALDDFREGLPTEAPRTDWLFFDCCADVPAKALEAFGGIGQPLIQGSPSARAAAEQAYGKCSQFGFASSRLGRQAFGLANAPSRFCEMLLDALNGAAAEEKDQAGTWWITERGIVDAMVSYHLRTDRLDTPAKRRFYEDPGAPMSPDAGLSRMRFRSINGMPKSRLVATSLPATALKDSALAVVWEGNPGQAFWSQNPPGARSRLIIDLEPRRTYTLTASFGQTQKQIEIFSHLPLADRAEINYG